MYQSKKIVWVPRLMIKCNNGKITVFSMRTITQTNFIEQIKA